MTCEFCGAPLVGLLCDYCGSSAQYEGGHQKKYQEQISWDIQKLENKIKFLEESPASGKIKKIKIEGYTVELNSLKNILKDN